MPDPICQDRICIVTGAGRGIGREYALALAHHGAKVVVNDVGGSRDGSGGDAGPAQEVVSEITAAGGQAVANTDDISTWDGGRNIVAQAVDTYGGIDVVINNAGIVRDRMIFSMEEAEWDAVIQVHLKGTFCTTRPAAAFWRDRAKQGLTNDARIINTTSVAGLYANMGQTNYGAAKAGIAAFTQIAAEELGRYGVTANCVAPGAMTRMTADLGLPEEMASKMDPKWVAPTVVWLASRRSADVTGQVIESSGLIFGIAQGWTRGPSVTDVPETPEEVDELARKLLAQATPRSTWADISG